MLESVKGIVNCVFDCFSTDIVDEVVNSKSEREKAMKEKKDGDESKYVQMEPIVKVSKDVDEPLNQSAKKSKRLIFRDVENASSRLTLFNNFCVQNQTVINQIVKSIFS